MCAAVLPAENLKPFNRALIWSGALEHNPHSASGGSLQNRGELKLLFPAPSLTLRGGVLDSRPVNLAAFADAAAEKQSREDAWNALWGENEKRLPSFTAGLYHKNTGSRLLYGILDEWGLPARIRNPWIRSAPYAENHQPIMSDLKTAASSTKKDEAYLYLSSPFLNLSPNVKLKGFVSAQSEVNAFAFPAFSGGLDFALPKKSRLSIESFYTQATLPSAKSNAWFSASPPLPERDFRLSAAALLYSSPYFSVKTDWAVSETFAVGTDIYGSLGLSISPPFQFSKKDRPLLFSFAADGAGGRFVGRDGVNHGAGFRNAAKIELKGVRSALLRFDTVLRSPAFGDDFYRSSTGVFYRAPARNADSANIRLTRAALSVSRDAGNTEKISDGVSGGFGFSVFFPQAAKKDAFLSEFKVNLAAGVKGLTSTEGTPSPYPILSGGETWLFDAAETSCEFSVSPKNLQFRTKFGYSTNTKNSEKWDFSLSAAYRFNHGRLTIKAVSPDFPEKWNGTVSWRLERKN